jgi:uncharacterized protein YfbU (UPF0304 family)
MNLTKSERLILLNQHKILEKLDKEESEYHKKMQDIMQNGYDCDLAVYDPIPEGTETEVYKTLQMFLILNDSYSKLSEEEKKNIPIREIQFQGYDGNANDGCYGFLLHIEKYKLCSYLRKISSEIAISESYNMPDTRVDYQQKLARWEAFDRPSPMSKEEILHVINLEEKEEGNEE